MKITSLYIKFLEHTVDVRYVELPGVEEIVRDIESSSYQSFFDFVT